MKKNKIKKTKNCKKINILSIILYVLAVIFLGYAVFSIYDTHAYISELISYESINMDTQKMEVLGYYVSTSSPYFFYAIVTSALAYIIGKISSLTQNNTISCNEQETTIEVTEQVEDNNTINE